MRKIIFIIILALADFSALAGEQTAIVFTEDATITDVQAVIEKVMVRRKHLERDCKKTRYSEESDVEQSFLRPSDLIGGAAGALLGNTLGKGSGKTALAAVGAILGSRTGRFLEQRHAAAKNVNLPTRRQCNERYVWRRVPEQQERYRVSYEWQGRPGSIMLDELPNGDTIRLFVRASPDNRRRHGN